MHCRDIKTKIYKGYVTNVNFTRRMSNLYELYELRDIGINGFLKKKKFAEYINCIV